ncbi:reverse transcriptase domain-containing protein [Tanacetum coccineum]
MPLFGYIRPPTIGLDNTFVLTCSLLSDPLTLCWTSNMRPLLSFPFRHQTALPFLCCQIARRSSSNKLLLIPLNALPRFPVTCELSIEASCTPSTRHYWGPEDYRTKSTFCLDIFHATLFLHLLLECFIPTKCSDNEAPALLQGQKASFESANIPWFLDEKQVLLPHLILPYVWSTHIQSTVARASLPITRWDKPRSWQCTSFIYPASTLTFLPLYLYEMMRVTTAFLQGEVAASNREWKNSFLSWKQQEANQKQNFKKGGFRNQQRSERKQDRFALLTKIPKEIFALDKEKIKALPPMKTLVEKRNANKFCEFHGEIGHNTDECMHLRKQIEEMLKAGMLSHLVKEIKQNNGKEQPKVTKKGETVGKDKAMVILMVQPWERVVRQRITGEIIWPVGQIQLLVTIRDEEHSASALKNLVVVRSPSPYNGIIGRPGVRKLQAVPSTVYGMLKIPIDGGVITLKSSSLLQQNLDIFAWKPADMTSVPRHIAEHRLNVRKGCSLVRQKKMGQAADKNQAIQKEVGKLVEAGIMKEVHYHDWLSNLVMNAGATYQHLVDKAFHKQISRNLEVYVDELVIKSRTEDEIVRDMEETFQTLREINMKLNPKKCTFGIEEGMFLGKSDFYWTTEAEEAFKKMKQLIAELLSGGSKRNEYAIQYKPRVSVKGQILADFIVERPEEESLDTLMGEEDELPEPWILFDATNNEAEYEALIVGLKITEQMGVKNLQANVDSRLVANQVNGTYVAKENDMVRYLEKVKTFINSFKAFSIKQVPRSENKKADALSKIASTSFAHMSKQVLVEELKEKSISTVEVLAVVEEEGDTWMTPIFKYLMNRTLPTEVKKARAVKRKSWRFSIINGTLYKKSFLGPWLRCVGPLQDNYVLREIHEGSCSMHAGTRSVVAKALWIGYYWPTMHENARKLIRACQVHTPVPRSPQQKLSPITSPWPLYKWGIDIVGLFRKGLEKINF